MADQSEILLVPGENIALWPEVKLGRAYAHMMELQQRIEEWEALRPIRSKASQTTETELSIALDVRVAPPQEAIATIFGDAIHNLRSALDAVTWEMANFDGNHPASERAEKAVQFPLFDDPTKFIEWGKLVGSIPDSLLVRLERQQPYNRSEALAREGKVDTLVMLHSFDIADKHRNSISAVGVVRDLSTITVTIRGDASQLTVTPEPRAPLTTDAVLVRFTSAEPIELLTFVGGPVTAQFDIPAKGGFAPVLDILGTMAGKVRVTLDDLYGALLPPEDAGSSMVVRFDGEHVKTITE
jgi:hypothetical protein